MIRHMVKLIIELWETHSVYKLCLIDSNRQGTSLTVKDLIAMSRVKDCLSGALLFVKEVVMTSIVAGQLD